MKRRRLRRLIECIFPWCRLAHRFQAARSQLDKVTAAAHARNKATFNPQIAETSAPKTPAVSKPKRRVSMGVVVDAETGEVMESGKRHSLRRNTLMATSISEIRARDEQEKKVSLAAHSIY